MRGVSKLCKKENHYSKSVNSQFLLNEQFPLFNNEQICLEKNRRQSSLQVLRLFEALSFLTYFSSYFLLFAVVSFCQSIIWILLGGLSFAVLRAMPLKLLLLHNSVWLFLYSLPHLPGRWLFAFSQITGRSVSDISIDSSFCFIRFLSSQVHIYRARIEAFKKSVIQLRIFLFRYGF